MSFLDDRGDLPAPDKDPLRIRTPHAALLVWNYVNRVSSSPLRSFGLDSIEELHIASASCISIKTSKSKGDPQGSFQVELAPTKNWVSLITPGSWCVVLMSNQPITKEDFIKVDAAKLKMFGKIDTVRLDTKVSSAGARTTTYNISGVDWAHIFHNTIYIDNNLASESDPKTLGNGAALAIQALLLAKDGQPIKKTTDAAIRGLMNIFGKELPGYSAQGDKLGLLATPVYTFDIPSAVVNYLNLLDANGIPSKATNLNKVIKLITGRLIGPNKYDSSNPAASGFINPFSLQGTHSFWQILQDNSCPPINEMIAEMRPSSKGTSLCLYNRIKPFTINKSDQSFVLKATPGGSKVLSYFQYIKVHLLDSFTVSAINAGTNWQDKFNFAEIKPAFAELPVIEAILKPYTQTFDPTAFNREGFKPIIYTAKYLPGLTLTKAGIADGAWNELQGWVMGLRTWYFDTHKMLNGTVVMTGIDGYIGIGDNIKLDSKLINPNDNFNLGQTAPTDSYLLAHVESVSHVFTVNSDGARSYTTQVQFTRGIITDSNGNSLSLGVGAVDALRSTFPKSYTANNDDTFFVSTSEDPSPGVIK